MTDLRKAAEIVLEAISKEPESFTSWVEGMKQAKEALRQALAQPEQEPVAWNGVCVLGHCNSPSGCETSNCCRADYTAPPKREWVGMTEWKPIETAPKDGTEVLVMYLHIDTQVVHNGFWLGTNDTDDESDIGWWSYEHSEVSRIKLDDWMTPTHWLPLPKLKEKNT